MKKSILLRSTIILIIIATGLAVFQYLRPLPLAVIETREVSVPTSSASSLPWPSYGQSAIGADNFGLLDQNGEQKPAPIASVAKVFTAIAVLKEKPLNQGEQGPSLTIDSTDLGYYSYYYGNDGSVARVSVGEQITEYQALQALLLPSANNIADSLARWVFDSNDKYVTYANSMVKAMGLQQTTIGSPSGFTADTTSTASDLVKIGLIAEQNPVIAEIVSQDKADIPVAGTIANVNWLLGSDGVNGIKTGNTNEAGGCYLFSAKRTVQGEDINLVGAVIGASSLNQAIKDSRVLIRASDNGFENQTVVTKGTVVGSYTTAWGAKANAVVAKDESIFLWKGQEPTIEVNLNKISGAKTSGASVGDIVTTYEGVSQTTAVILDKTLSGPTLSWRILRR